MPRFEFQILNKHNMIFTMLFFRKKNISLTFWKMTARTQSKSTWLLHFLQVLLKTESSPPHLNVSLIPNIIAYNVLTVQLTRQTSCDI